MLTAFSISRAAVIDNKFSGADFSLYFFILFCYNLLIRIPGQFSPSFGV